MPTIVLGDTTSKSRLGHSEASTVWRTRLELVVALLVLAVSTLWEFLLA